MTWEATPTRTELQGTIFDLARRVRALEQEVRGTPLPGLDLVLSVRCYRDAHRAHRALDAVSASAWVAQAYLWDTGTLIRLGTAVADPFPYRPLVAVLDHCVHQGVEGATEARTHLLSVAQDLLNALGLELLRPRDTMRTLQLQASVAGMGLPTP